MTPMDNVKAKIIELVPEINQRTCDTCANYACIEHVLNQINLSITLADVLRATQKAQPLKIITVDTEGNFVEQLGYEDWDTLFVWNLLEHYDNQTPELKAFVGKLLGVTG